MSDGSIIGATHILWVDTVDISVPFTHENHHNLVAHCVAPNGIFVYICIGVHGLK